MNKKKAIKIMDVNIHPYKMDEVLEYLSHRIKNKEKVFIVTANAEIIMMCQSDSGYKKIVNEADIVLPDGAGTVWAGNFLGFNIPERVAGFDLFINLLKQSADENNKIYFLGAAPGVAQKASDIIMKKDPAVSIVGHNDGFFSESDEESIINKINNLNVDILFVALGAPKQELWIKRNLDKLNVSLVVGIGGSFDVVAGNAKRAPKWMQNASLEWLYRLYKQPSRFIRMLVLPKFVYRIFKVRYLSN